MIALKPRVSEKAIAKAESGVFVFDVPTSATKPMIKQAVEAQFKVKVTDVTVIVLKGKVKQFKRITGREKDVKKAYVKLAKGQSIKLFEGAK